MRIVSPDMFQKLRQVFSRSNPAVSKESRSFMTKLASSDIWILAVGLRGTPAIPSITDPTAWEIIAAHRIDVCDVGDDDSVFPFNYGQATQQVLPFFSSEERALAFRANSGFKADLSHFQPFGVLTGFIATAENDMFELIIDPRSPGERMLSRDERLLLRELSTKG